MNNERTTRKKKRKINRILTVILLVAVLIFFSTIFYINIIPILYTIISLVLVLALVFGIVVLNFRKKRFLRIIGYILSTLFIAIIIFILVYLFNTLGFLFNITDGDYTLHNYNVMVLNTSSYSDIEDIENKLIGIGDTTDGEELDKAKKNIDKKADVKYKNYEDIYSLLKGLINNEIEGIILENSEVDLIKEENNEEYNLLKIIYEVEIKNDIKDLKDAININNEPFNIYISGIDTYGKINSSSRSDVNIIVTVNPKSEKILITWIPRDYYVHINDSEYKDKLTHAGIYGINSSIYAVEKLLDIDINYYVKVNFTSVMKIIDLLGGVTVYNDEAFISQDGITYKEGTITLNGHEALSFVRERKNLSEGDLGRGKNQIKVLESLINKAMSPSILKKYNDILKSLDDAFVTNMSQNTMFAFIRTELFNRRDWKIDSNTLIGKDSYEYTYSYKNTALYVMIPDKESVTSGTNKIKELMNES